MSFKKRMENETISFETVMKSQGSVADLIETLARMAKWTKGGQSAIRWTEALIVIKEKHPQQQLQNTHKSVR